MSGVLFRICLQWFEWRVKDYAGHRILSFILWIGSEKRYESAVHVLVHVLLSYIRYGSVGLAVLLFQHSLSTFTWSNSSFGNAREVSTLLSIMLTAIK